MTDLSIIQTGDIEKHPVVRFETENTIVKGVVVSSRIADIPSLRPGEAPRTTLIIDIQVDQAATTAVSRAADDVDETDGVWTLFCKPAAMRAIAAAVRATGGRELQDGARIAVRRGPDNKAAQKPGQSAPHTFDAAYEPPAAGADMSALL